MPMRHFGTPFSTSLSTGVERKIGFWPSLPGGRYNGQVQWHTVGGALESLRGLIGQYGGYIAAVLLVVMAVAVGAAPRGKP